MALVLLQVSRKPQPSFAKVVTACRSVVKAFTKYLTEAPELHASV
jgi:hypothetical protein